MTAVPRALMISIIHWTLGNALVLLPKVGRTIYNGRSYRSKGTFNYGLMIPLSPHLEVLWWRRQELQVLLMMPDRLHHAALGRRRNQ